MDPRPPGGLIPADPARAGATGGAGTVVGVPTPAVPTPGPPPSDAFTWRSGVVDAFDEAGGAGTLVDDLDGRTWWFHCTRLADGTRTTTVGTPVRYRAEPGPTGLEASHVG